MLAAVALVIPILLASPSFTSAQPDGVQCLRVASPPAARDGDAVFAQPLDTKGSKPNVVVIPAGFTWDASACGGAPAGDVMTHPTSIAVASGSAVLLRDQPAGLFSAWGAKDVTGTDPAPVLFPGSSDWTTTAASVVDPDFLLNVYGSCRNCSLAGVDFTPVQARLPTIAYQANLSGADLSDGTLHGNLSGWNLSGADLSRVRFADASLTGAVLDQTVVNRTAFDGTDLRGAHLTALRYRVPPSLSGVQVGAFNGSCTVITDSDLLNARFMPNTPLPGCETTPLLPGSQVPLALIDSLFVKDHANVNFGSAQFVADASDRTVLAGADLHAIHLEGAAFLGFPADLVKTDFDDANLHHTSFELADLSKATFRGATADGASFEDARLNEASFASHQTGRTDLHGADFFDADVSGASFQGADLSDAAFNRALAVDTNFNAVVARNTVFQGAHIYGAGQAFNQATNLQGADFSEAVLAGDVTAQGGFDFTHADLTGAKFDKTQCIGCNFTDSKLDEVSFSGAYLPGTVLAGTTTLSGANLIDAWLYCGQSNKVCPKDSTAPSGHDWPLALGSRESFGPVPFAGTELKVSLASVTACPDGSRPTAGDGCNNRLLPKTPLTLPLACSAAALDACPTRTSTLVHDPSIGSPLALASTTPSTWATTLTAGGYYAAFDDATIRLVASDGSLALVAGQPGQRCATATDACGDGGPATQARLGTPAGLAVGLDGSLYVADPTLHRVRVIAPSSQRAGCRPASATRRAGAGPRRTNCHGASARSPARAQSPGTIATVAGDGRQCNAPGDACGDGGPAIEASLAGPYGVWVGPRDDLFIADGRRGIREVKPDGAITTVGNFGSAYDIRSVVGDANGHLYAAAHDPDYLLDIDLATGKATKVVGTGTSGYNGNADPNSGSLLPGDKVQINLGPVNPGPGNPGGLAVTLEGDVVFADTGNNLIRAYVPKYNDVINLGGVVSDDGKPQGGFNQDGCFADQTELNHPDDLAVTRGPGFAVADTGNQRVRRLGPTPNDGQPACRPQPRAFTG